MKPVRALGLLILISSSLSADVIVLTNGTKVGGRVVDKGLHYEITTEAGLRTYLRDEVDHVITSPKELLGDADKSFEEVKSLYTEAIAVQDPSDRNARLHDAIDKLRALRETFASTRELFPEDKYSDLDQKLLATLQLMRLLRERVSVDLAKKSETINPRPSASAAASAREALATLIDPALRADPVKRSAAHDAYKGQRADSADVHDLATAAMLFLERSDADWRLKGASLKVLQEYFAKPWIKDPTRLTPAAHLEAASWLATQAAAVKKTEAGASVDALLLFGAGHLGHALSGPAFDRAAMSLGLSVQNGVAGTPEGFIIRDLDGLIGAGEFELASLAFIKEHRDSDSAAARYVWAYALTCLAQAKKKGFDRPVSALNSIMAASPILKDHLAALVHSIKAAAVCSNCGGEGKLRCTNCHGVKEVRYPCAKCGGKGRYLPPGLVVNPNAPPRRLSYMTCLQCKGTGIARVIRCEKCKDGFVVCHQCGGKEKQAPEMADIFESTPCPDCDGEGCIFRNVRWVCPSCLGLGRKLAPKADPLKMLR